jgi:hypothetical protein
MSPSESAPILGELQSDVLHFDGADGSAGQTNLAIGALPDKLATLVRSARDRGTPFGEHKDF